MKILIADHDPDSRKSLETTIAQWGYEVLSAADGAAALKTLQQESAPEVALLDSDLQGMTGFEICRQARRANGGSTYLLLMLRKGAQKAAEDALAAGADDFLSKPVHPDELLARLRVGRRFLDLQAELRRAQEALSYQTTHDPMTGLYNRVSVLDALRRELARVKREQSPAGVILIEIDQFKQINDSYGHAVGDAVLREVARRLRTTVRPYDTVGRYGGQEFLLLVPGCDAESASAQAARLRACLAGEPINVAEWGKFKDLEKGLLTPVINVGVAAGKNVRDAETLLKAAEGALARARRDGETRLAIAPEAELA
jgi:diguanylate cyclase (GGDEF)-like protein